MAIRIVNLIAILVVGYALVTFTAYKLLESEENESHLGGHGVGGGGGNGGADARAAVRRYEHAKGAGGERRDVDLVRRSKPLPAVSTERTALRPKKKAAVPVLADAKITTIHVPKKAAPAKKDDGAVSKPTLTPRYPRRRRFPAYGSDEFTNRLCPWTSDALPPKRPNCTFVIQPEPHSNEGIAAWTAFVVMGYLNAKQAGCRLLLGYGAGVDVESVLVPPRSGPRSPTSTSGEEQEDQVALNNWTIPAGFRCSESDNCFRLTDSGQIDPRVTTKMDLLPVPNYRHAYVGLMADRFDPAKYVGLGSALRDFNLDLGMACSLGVMFHLAPGASEYEPELFKSILPALRDDTTLAISLYIRTGYTDRVAHSEQTKEIPEDTMKGRANSASKENVGCALSLEKEFLSNAEAEGAAYARVVWLVISDSTAVKEWVNETYGGKETATRRVLYTSSHGAHTKPKRGPSTGDFASALIDWYLIGESDAVVTTGGLYSFGVTAALRTARPLYSAMPRSWNRTCVGGCVCSKLFDASVLL